MKNLFSNVKKGMVFLLVLCTLFSQGSMSVLAAELGENTSEVESVSTSQEMTETEDVVSEETSVVESTKITSADGLFEYEKLSNTTISITGYKGSQTTLAIPNKIDGFDVAEIIAVVFLRKQLKTLGAVVKQCVWSYRNQKIGGSILRKSVTAKRCAARHLPIEHKFVRIAKMDQLFKQCKQFIGGNIRLNLEHTARAIKTRNMFIHCKHFIVSAIYRFIHTVTVVIRAVVGWNHQFFKRCNHTIIITYIYHESSILTIPKIRLYIGHFYYNRKQTPLQ